ncbi:FAD binding domain protein [Synechococcus sp. BIOS-E4-1]|uniref:FAD-dependent oxidoreductase n=1 Tax=Synechococcus sp. BIOS-E4-1 TaxID=1400864 RepID=UPI001646DAB2|nr:FAD-dependent oxidoreductase [Synechococcus sp. BIOS-E4-1]QNI53837.1 FAD binding domain protein [Synechococcus sp. BIOS-E4-1]
MHIAVVGGGVTGLFTALVLQQRGYGVTVFDTTTRPHSADYGLCLSPAAQLTPLLCGLVDFTQALLTAGLSQSETLFFDADSIDGNTEESSSGLITPLQIRSSMLLGLLRSSLQPQTIIPDVVLQGVHQQRGRIELEFAGRRGWQGELLIAADGLHSRTLDLLEVERPLIDLGQRFWRALADDGSVLRGGVFHRYGSHDTLRLTAFDVGPDPCGCEQTHWCLFVASPAVRRSERLESVTQRSFPPGALQGLPESIVQMIQSTDPSSITTGRIMDAEPLDQLVYGNVALLGDAAHPMAPTQARGVSSGFEDAVVLADSLDRHRHDLEAALGDFQQRRLPVVKQQQRLSRQEQEVA